MAAYSWRSDEPVEVNYYPTQREISENGIFIFFSNKHETPLVFVPLNTSEQVSIVLMRKVGFLALALGCIPFNGQWGCGTCTQLIK